MLCWEKERKKEKEEEDAEVEDLENKKNENNNNNNNGWMDEWMNESKEFTASSIRYKVKLVAQMALMNIERRIGQRRT